MPTATGAPVSGSAGPAGRRGGRAWRLGGRVLPTVGMHTEKSFVNAPTLPNTALRWSSQSPPPPRAAHISPITPPALALLPEVPLDHRAGVEQHPLGEQLLGGHTASVAIPMQATCRSARLGAGGLRRRELFVFDPHATIKPGCRAPWIVKWSQFRAVTASCRSCHPLGTSRLRNPGHSCE